MFSLFKIAIDAGMALLIFYAGVKAEQNYPNLLSKLGTILSWVKALIAKA